MRRVKRTDLVAVAQGAALGALVAAVVVAVWTMASRPAEFPTTAAAMPTTFVVPTPTPRPELPITLAPDGLGIVSFGDVGEAALAKLTEVLGPPNGDEHWTCADPAGEVHFLQWADLGAFVIDRAFVGWVDAIHFPPAFGKLLELRTADGMMIGHPFADLEAVYGERLVATEPAPAPSIDTGRTVLREFDIDGETGLHAYVEGEGDEARLITLIAGKTCFDNSP